MDYREQLAEHIRMIQQFALSFEKVLEGSRSDDVNTSELSGGARINCVFHERFPFEVVKMEFDESELRKEIAIAIANIHGIRIGLFTPDLAFDAIVKKQITRLKDPCLKCVDLVSSELLNVVHNCSAQMSRFPRLREIVERVITNHVRKREQECRDQLSVYINCQLSYMNTNHEDFIGFANAESQARKTIPTHNNHLGNQVIRKGYMTLHNLSIIKGRSFWYVLSSDSLAWYKDETEKEIQYILPLNKLKLRDVETGFINRKPTFALFYPHGSNVYKDYKQLELSCASVDDMDSWKASFLRAGVYPEKPLDNNEDSDEDNIIVQENVDPQLKRQVEVIRNLVESYMSIVTKATKDLVPKIITHMIIKNTKKYIFEELLVSVYAQDDQVELLEESPEEVRKREEKMAMFQACKTALDIIGDCSMKFSSSKTSTENEVVHYKPAIPSRPTAATKQSYRLSTPPPVFSRPAPPPPPGKMRKFKSERNISDEQPIANSNLIPKFYVLSIP